MSFFLMRQGENGLQDKFENIIKRIVLNSTYLLTILSNVESKFGTTQRSIRGGHELYSNFNNFKGEVKGILERVASLLEFVKEREDTAKAIAEEIKKINENLGYTGWNFFNTYSVNEHTIKSHHEKIKQILSEEEGHLKLLKYFHKELLNIREGLLIKL